MANANAIVDKLKDFGLRHGEKLGVAIASTVFVVCVVAAVRKETIETTPEQIKSATKQSDTNLNRTEDPEKIVQNLEKNGIKDSNFAKTVDDQVKTELDPGQFKAAHEWVSIEPGAGVIRETPVLIAPEELYAYPGRGGFLVFDLDKNGDRIPDDGKDQPKSEARKRRRKRRGRWHGRRHDGGNDGRPRTVRKKGPSLADREAEAKAEQARKAAALAKKLAGNDAGAAGEEEAKKAAPAGPEEQFKEVTKGHRWVCVTGVLDHAQLVANYRAALKNPAHAQPHYSKIALQRQTQLPDGTWSKWEDVSADERYKVLDNLPEVEEEELTPDEVRPDALVDPLPFLKSGLWEGVHVAKLVPREKKVIAKEDIRAGAGMMGGGMMAGGMRGGSGGQMGMANMQQQNNAMMEMMQGNRGGRLGGGMMGGGMMAGGMMGGGTQSAGNYWKTDAKKVMIRVFDFTVKPDTSYRYRAAVVVFNPNRNHEDTKPGTDTKSKTLQGPWSDTTDEAHMPPDTMPYATDIEQATRSADMKVKFQVVRFRPADGVTVTRNYAAGPGEVIGEPGMSLIPSSDGSKPKSTLIDFTSHQIVLDVFGNKKTAGYQQLPSGMIGPPLQHPAVAVLLRPDGSIAVHNEADDVVNEVRRDIDANYRQEIKDSGKERKSSFGSGMMGMGMMGGMGGMRGGGLGGGMR